jgi:hypothetical protein
MVQQHAVSLLRSGEITTFPALFKRVMDDIRHDMAMAGPGTTTNGSAAGTATNTAEVNGASSTGPEGSSNGTAAGGTARPNLAVPQGVIEEALKITGECLEQVCELDKNGTT